MRMSLKLDDEQENRVGEGWICWWTWAVVDEVAAGGRLKEMDV